MNTIKIKNQILLSLLLTVLSVLIACSTPGDQAGGTITEPYIAHLGGSVQNQAKTSKAYLYDTTNPYQAIDSAEVIDGKFKFTKEAEIPQQVRVLVHGEDQGFLTPALNENTFNKENAGDYFQLTLENYELDTLTLDSNVDLNQAIQLQAQFSASTISKLSDRVYVIPRLSTQEIVKIQIGDTTSLVKIENTIITTIEGPEVVEILSLDEEQKVVDPGVSPELALEAIFDNVAGGQMVTTIGDSIITIQGSGYSLSTNQLAEANKAVAFTSATFVTPTNIETHTNYFMSISFWFQPNCASDCGVIGTVDELNNQDGRAMAIKSNKITFYTQTDSDFEEVVASPTLSNGQWYHVVYQYTAGEKVKVYLDGTLAAQGLTNTPANLQSPKVFTIGYSAENIDYGVPGAEGFFEGSISEFRQWKRLLTPAEITTLASGTLP